MHAPPPAVGCRRTLSASCPGTAPRPASTARLTSPARGCPAARRLTLVRYCGRTFSAQELELIRSLMAEHPGHHRLALSRLVCERLDWRRPNGGLKDMSCRVALLRMHRDLGYTPLAGAQLRYLVLSGPQVLAVLGFAACAWKVAPRDRFIGWSAAQREARLPLVVNNARFLLPCRQLDPRRANPRPRQTRCPQPTRSAQEGHLALSAPPRFPPPPLRPARSSPQPVDRIFTLPLSRVIHSSSLPSNSSIKSRALS